MRVALPYDVFESDIIRLLIIIWKRKNWLKIEDDESFIDIFL
jgi:hypothetical protein